MGLLLWCSKKWLGALFTAGEVNRFVGLLIMVAVGLTSYGLAALLLRAIEWREIKGLLARRQ